ncbi:hypothetical protein ACUOIV_28565, partial [Escherichia coli]
ERGFAIIRTGSGQAPTPDADIAELGEGRVVAVASMLFAAPEVTLDRRDVDRTLDLTLTGSMANYDWGFNGTQFDMHNPLRGAHALVAGERVR